MINCFPGERGLLIYLIRRSDGHNEGGGERENPFCCVAPFCLALSQLKTTVQPLLGSAGKTSDKSSWRSFNSVPFELPVTSPGTDLEDTV